MISILNYGIGNISAFSNLFDRLNVPFNIVSTKSELLKSQKILFPGVGSFDNSMSKLNNSGLRNSLEDLVIKKKVPILGVCVGMQMFAENSEEGNLEGLGWFNANVRKFNTSPNILVPHMGWNNISIQKNHIITNDLSQESFFYFLHSYYFSCKNTQDIVCNTTYGSEFSSIVNKNNITGVQFHPEKSHSAGQILLSNFASFELC